MPNTQLAVTRHFEIVWWSGADSRGLYVSQTDEDIESGAAGHFSGFMTKLYARDIPQFFVDRRLVPSLIVELRSDKQTITLLSRVTHAFVPGFHRVPKKDGGIPGQAYYTPLIVEGEHRQELADALEFACSKENVSRLEQNNSAESYCVLNNDYLENGAWHSDRWFEEHWDEFSSRSSTAIHLSSAKLEQAPKIRFRAPSLNIYGNGTTLLRTSKTKQRCYNRPCIDYYWIDPNEQYVEHRQGSRIERYHIKCAFRTDKIPNHWLSPHFELYYSLMGIGLQGWIEKEREKKDIDNDEILGARSDSQRVAEFVKKVKDGYDLDEYERKEWRDYLHHVPVDIEPYETARRLVDLPDLRSLENSCAKPMNIKVKSGKVRE